MTDADTKQPLADATVSLASAAGTGSVPMQRMATTDSNGRFQFTDIVPQAYTLNAQKTDYQFDKRSLTAADDGSTENLSIELVHGQGIGIQVRDGLYGVPMRSVIGARPRREPGPPSSRARSRSTRAASARSRRSSRAATALFVNASGYATVVPRERLGAFAAARAGHPHAGRLGRHHRSGRSRS